MGEAKVFAVWLLKKYKVGFPTTHAAVPSAGADVAIGPALKEAANTVQPRITRGLLVPAATPASRLHLGPGPRARQVDKKVPLPARRVSTASWSPQARK